MPFISDLGQLERDFESTTAPGKEPKKKKIFKKVDLPLSIMGDQAVKEGMMVVAVIVGPIKGFQSREFSKEVTIEAQKGGIYMKAGEGLEARITKAFGNKNSEHNSSHEE